MTTRQLNHIHPSLEGEVSPQPKNDVYRTGTIVSYTYLNTMRVPVFWKSALGVMFVEHSYASANGADEKFYVTISYEFDNGVSIDSRELLHEMSRPSKCVERKAVLDTLRNLDYNPNHLNPRRGFQYTLSVSREKLEACGGVAYINDLDVVIGFDAHRDSAVHPYSAEGQVKRLSEAIVDYQGFQQRYLIIDSSGKFGPRWVNTGNGIGELVPIKDPSLRDGVYVTIDPGPNHEPKTKYYPLSEADEALGLFRHYDQALTFGSPEEKFKQAQALREEEILILKKDLQELKTRADVEKARFEMEKLEWEKQHKLEEERFKRIEMERTHLDNQLRFERERHQEAMKYRYDTESRTAKHTVEMTKVAADALKIFLGIVVTVIGFIIKDTAFKK